MKININTEDNLYERKLLKHLERVVQEPYLERVTHVSITNRNKDVYHYRDLTIEVNEVNNRYEINFYGDSEAKVREQKNMLEKEAEISNFVQDKLYSLT